MGALAEGQPAAGGGAPDGPGIGAMPRPSQAPGKALPSPGDILRMNAAAKAAAGGGSAEGGK